jgi:cadmium resistance protein CadD (predicted permease)
MEIEQMALLIPIIGIVLGVVIAIVAIVTSHREKLKRAEQRHRERLAAIEKGIELPLDPEPDGDARKGGSLKSGLTGLFLGIVLYLALREVADPDIALFGLIPAAIGIASLISHLAESRRNGDAGKAPPSP